MILLIVIVIIITINVIDIRFDEAGIASETIVKNMVYESKAVIESPTRSPDSTGRRNTSGLSATKSVDGHMTMIL
jgi:hypothetical protein